MSENDWTTEDEQRLVRRLRDLADGPEPPGSSERRIVAELRARGLLRSGRAWPRRLLATAAALILFAGGVLLGRAVSDGAPAATAPPPRYALFLLGGVEAGPDEAALVEEYRAWAAELARAERLAAGEKLAPEAWLLGGERGAASLETPPEAHRAAPLSGFFLLTVDDPAEALAIARSCPHLRHGGRVLLRPIEPT